LSTRGIAKKQVLRFAKDDNLTATYVLMQAMSRASMATDDKLWSRCIAADDCRTPFLLGCSWAMNHQDNLDREREVRERIAALMQAAGQARTKQITDQELQKLKTAANHLDQMLNDAEEADREALRNAAARLDRLLADIGARKNVAGDRKQRRDRKDGKD